MAPIFQPIHTESTIASSIGDAFNSFRTQHAGLFIFLVIIYSIPTLIGLIHIATLASTPRAIPYLHPIFLEDGILVCCCPLAVILPLILWPLVLVNTIFRCILHQIYRALRWVLNAPTFCGIRRYTYRQWAVSLRMKIATGFRRVQKMCSPQDRKSARAAQQEAAPIRVHRRHGYGTIRSSPTVSNPSPPTSTGHFQYQRVSNMDPDAASIVSAPPPYSQEEFV